MKKLLLLAAGALLSTSAMNAQWAVVGAYCDWHFETATTFEGEGDDLSCTIEHLTSGFKIVDITNNNWDVQYGSSTAVEIGVPATLEANGADIAFANDVLAVNDAKITWNPTTEVLTITGTAEDAPSEISEIYLVGVPNEWSINESSYVLSKVEDGVYQGTFEIAAGSDIYFRFYTYLGSWGADGELPSIGPLPNDNTNVAVEFTDGEFVGECTPGKGSWNIPTWDGGTITMMVDMNDWTVAFTAGNAGVENLGVDLNAPAEYYNLNGVKVINPAKGGVYVVKQGNKTSKVVIR